MRINAVKVKSLATAVDNNGLAARLCLSEVEIWSYTAMGESESVMSVCYKSTHVAVTWLICFNHLRKISPVEVSYSSSFT